MGLTTQQPQYRSSLTTIKVSKETADLMKVYCVFNGKTIAEFASGVLDKELSGFKRRLDTLRTISSES